MQSERRVKMISSMSEGLKFTKYLLVLTATLHLILTLHRYGTCFGFSQNAFTYYIIDNSVVSYTKSIKSRVDTQSS